MTEDLGPSGAEKFKRAQQYLLPNEEVKLVCQIQDGFLVLSNRRVVLMKEERGSDYRIEKAIPYDCILSFESMKGDRVEISGILLDQYGCHTIETKSFEVKASRGESGETKIDARSRFQTTLGRCSDVVEEIRQSDEFTGEIPPARDYSYLEQMPESLTRNAILDLNTVLRDQPIHDELVHEALKFLGAAPFLLEESLRDGADKENGVLFAAGSQGYYWIQGTKQGRFLSNVIVDAVEWDNIRCFSYQWHNESAIIDATYTLTKDGKESKKQYQWSPPTNNDTLKHPWLLQRMNGIWILADIVYNYSGTPLPASYANEPMRYYH